MSIPDSPNIRGLMILAIGFLYLSFLLQSGSNVKAKHASIDFASYYTASQALFIQDSSPYPIKNLEVYRTEIGKQQVYPYVYPPPSLLLFYPLSRMSFQQAQWFALIMNHILLVGVFVILLLILQKRFQVTGMLPLLLFSVYFFNFEPLIDTFTIGQINLLVLFCISGIWWLISSPQPPKGSGIVIGLLLALGILLKIYPLILLMFFLIRKDFKIILFTLAWIGLFSVLAYQLLPHGIWMDWMDLMQAKIKIDPSKLDSIPPGYPWNISLNGFFSRLFIENQWTKPLVQLPWLSTLLTCCSIAILAGFTFWKSYTVRQSRNRVTQHQVFGLYLLTMFLIAPISWGHHLVLILPAILLALSFLTRETLTKNSVMLVIGSLFILGLKVPYWHRFFYSPYLTWIISIKMYSVLAVWIYLYRKLQSANTDNAVKIVNL